MWVKLIRFSKGTGAFRVEGVEIERFINLCVVDKVRIRNYAVKETTLTGIVDAKKYKEMARIAKKCYLKSRVIEKNGAMFITRRYRKRYGILVGVAIFTVFIYSMGLFLWDIQINCSDKVDKENLLSFINENGLKIGAFSKSIDVK
ncbi:MAG: sporulation protein YqfD, partial [Oscillospiraceae bacterium]